REAPEPIPLISQVSGQSPIRIGTHNGTFHCDEGLACFLLRQLPEYKVLCVLLAQCDVVVDVGGCSRSPVLRPSPETASHTCIAQAAVVHSKTAQCCDWCRVLWIPAGSCCCCPWKEHLFVLEKQLKLDVLIKFVLYPDQSGHWRVQCVPAGLNTFQNRLSLLEEWRGLQNEALSERSGIPGCIFVHASGFIGDNWTLEMAKRMLQTAPRAVLSTRHTLKTPSACTHYEKYIQVHLNKLECRGKVHLFQ
uniref:Myg1 exonuclease n=1 Tax=Sinocyclocheilus grahami TaxID=75366 RepID=A0A672L3C4_SINGR